MKNKAYTLIELLSVIVILAIISAIAVPKVLDTIGVAKITAYNASKKNIIKSAKIKYLADVNDSNVIEYTVDDLITDGYLKKNIKNPLTNEDYKDTKVLITKEDGKIKYEYIEGNTLYDIIINLNDKDGLYKDGNNYIYKGLNPNNYVTFNGEIYRVLKLDSYRNIYLLKDEIKNNIQKNQIDEFLVSYLNDNYLEKAKDNIVSLDILTFDDFNKSFIDNESYITLNNNIWVKNNKEYVVLSNITNNITDKANANTRIVLKMKGSISIKSGNGTQLNPYEIEK